jgi:hypothetical protein
VRFQAQRCRCRRVELRQLKPAVAVRVRIIAMSTRTPSSPTTRSTKRPSIGAWALQLHTKFDKKRSSGLKVVDNDADVVHPLNRHIAEHRVGPPGWPRPMRVPHRRERCMAGRIRRKRRTAVSAQVGRHHPVVLGQPGGNLMPCRVGTGLTVQQHDWCASAAVPNP